MNEIRTEIEFMEEYRNTRYDDEEEGFDWWQLCIILMFALMVLGMLSGCTTTKYVSVPEYHTQYITKSDTTVRYDSVRIHDSVFVYRNGDTVIMNKVAYRDRWQNVYRVKVDTIVKTDSIPYPVEKELTSKERRYMNVGRYVCGSLMWVILLVVIGWLAWTARKKAAK